MKVCPDCGCPRLRVLIVIPGGDEVQCDDCGRITDYEDLRHVPEHHGGPSPDHLPH